VNDKYYSSPSLIKSQIREALGEEFTRNFLATGTRDPMSISPEILAMWLKVIGGDPPGSLGDNALPIEFAPQDVANRAQSFYDTRNAYFPNYFEEQEDYYKLDDKAQKAYLVSHPSLKQYWDWKWDWLHRNPDAAPYLTEKNLEFPSEEALREAEAGQPNFLPQEWQQLLGLPAYSLALDFIEGEGMPTVAQDKLDEVALQLGLSGWEDIAGRMAESLGIEAQPAEQPVLEAPRQVDTQLQSALGNLGAGTTVQAEGALPSPPSYEGGGGGGMQFEGDFEVSQQPIVRLTAGEATIGKTTIDAAIERMKEVFPGIKDSAYKKAGAAFENPQMYERGSRFDPNIAAGGFAWAEFVSAGRDPVSGAPEVSFPFSGRIIPRAIEVANAGDLSVFIHEMAHQLDLVGPLGRRTSTSKAFLDTIEEFLRRPVTDSLEQAGVIRMMQEFPGVGGNPMAPINLFVDEPEREAEWGGPVELYASVMASAGGDLSRIPTPFQKFYDAFLKDVPPVVIPAAIVPKGAFALIEKIYGADLAYIIGENVGVSQRTGDLMISDEALSLVRKAARGAGMSPQEAVEDVLTILGIDF
jgi:hypothetical protein